MEKSQPQSQPDTVGFRQLWMELKRRKLLVAAILILGVAATAAYTAAQPVLYRSTASLLIENFMPSAQMLYNPYGDPGVSPDVIKANRILAESRPVLEAARKYAQATLHEDPEAPDVNDYQAHTDGQLLYLQVLDLSPARAAVYTNAWSDAFVEEMKKRSLDPLSLIVKQYDELVPVLRAEWQVKLKALHDFQQANMFDQKDYERNDIYDRIKPLLLEEAGDRVALIKLTAEHDWLKALPSIGYEELKVLPESRLDPDLARSKTELENRRSALRESLEKNKEDSEEVRAKRESLNDAQADLDKVVKRFIQNFDKQVANAEESYKKIHEQCVLAENQKQSLISKSLQWQVLKKAEEDAEKIYNDRFTQKSNTDLSKQMATTYARQWEKAIEPKQPFLPSWRRNIFGGVVISLLLSVLCVIGLDKLDDSIRTPKDLQRKPGLISMGMIPANEYEFTDSEGYTLVQHSGFSLVAEALRNLHIGLEVKYGTHRTGQPLVITVTSAMANEGKSLVSSNLALLFAGLGRKVLLVDADLRKRSLSKAYKTDGQPGLREIIVGAPFSAALTIPGPVPGLHLLPAGNVLANSTDTIQPEGFERALAQMKPGYDIIIFDTPPVLPMADACIMGQVSDVTILVVRSRKTTLRQVETAASNLGAANVKEVVCVVNGVDTADATAGAYIYGYGYGYGYGFEPDKARDTAAAQARATRAREKVRE